MWIRNRPSWALAERLVTPEHVYSNRREFLAAIGVTSGLAASFASEPETMLGAVAGATAQQTAAGRPDWLEIPDWPAADLYPAAANTSYLPAAAGRPISDEGIAASYNNFYEFTVDKDRVRDRVDRFETRPWTIEVDGLVDKPGVFDVDELLRKLQVEERVYRHRCVEAWSMVVPWTGFRLRNLLRLVQPQASASYVRFETALERADMPGVGEQSHYPWPYVEALNILEAENELAFLASGIYGHPLPKQHGAPLRLVTPWKYGFKSIKSIVKITLTDRRPPTFWNVAVPREYGFWACVHPDFPHPRWSQAQERPIPDGDPVPTLAFNGYGEQVAHLYRSMQGREAFY